MSDINSGEFADREFVTALICTEFGFRANVTIPELNTTVDCYRSEDRTIVEVIDSNSSLELPYHVLDKICKKHSYRMLIVRILAVSGAAISRSYLEGYGLKTVDLPVIMSEDVLTAYRNYLSNYLKSAA
ncbi:MAG: hypothetical protein ACE5KA_00100 [Nitrososphaerales archaeon]